MSDESLENLLALPDPEVRSRLTPLQRAVLELREAALKELAREPGDVGNYVRRHRPDLASLGAASEEAHPHSESEGETTP